MPKKERSFASLRVHRYLVLLILLLPWTFAGGQQGEIIVLSRKVGTTVDAEEKDILGLFPGVEGFESAQFFKLDGDRYVARIVTLDHTRRRMTKKHYTWKQIQRMKYQVDRYPEITEEVRAEHRYRLSYLSVKETIEQIPPSTFCTIRHVSGRRMTGTFVAYRDRMIHFQSPTKRIAFPITEIESITYRPFVDEGSQRKKAMSFGVGAVLGLGLEELWNLQSRPAADAMWNNRFTGVILGLVSGAEFFEAITILTSPRKFIAFTPEEVARMK
ncbi:MAG: hypothetical protein ACE5GH_03335 [Fidelibacterota bacterium]